MSEAARQRATHFDVAAMVEGVDAVYRAVGAPLADDRRP